MSQTLYPQLLRNTRPMSPMGIGDLRRQSPSLHKALLVIKLVSSTTNGNNHLSLAPRNGDRPRDRDLNSGNLADFSLGLSFELLLLGFFKSLDRVNEWHARGVGWRNPRPGPG